VQFIVYQISVLSTPFMQEDNSIISIGLVGLEDLGNT
jgi:hypothetical protein